MNKKKYHTKETLSANSSVDLPVATVIDDSPPPKKRKKKSISEAEHYVNGREFEEAIKEYYSTDIITDYLGNSIRKISCGLSYASNFINYSFKEDMVSDAVLKMFQALKHKKFKLDQGFSPFSYFTTIAFHAFISRIKKEKKHHQAIEDYKERQYTMLMNGDGDSADRRVYTRPSRPDADSYNSPNEYSA